MVYKRKIGNIDGYMLTDAASIITLATMLIPKIKPKGVAIALVITALCFVYATFVSQTRVNNQSAAKMGSKDENNAPTDVIETLPGHSVSNVDGVKVNGIVFKIPDGVHAIITQKGVVVKSIIGRMMYNLKGGVLLSPPDEAWIPLFNSNY
jgi:hypothetical protein